MSNVPSLMSLNEVAQVTSLSRTAIFKLRERGDFVRAVSLGEKRIAFPRDEVAAWVCDRIEARNAKVGGAA